ncbi:hypothetical protein BGX26_010594, partial [Mortierella sp. AD094]
NPVKMAKLLLPLFLILCMLMPFIEAACGPTNCICNKIQGQFCGSESVNPACLNTHVYECNGSTGKACDYGYRTSCARCGKLNC